MLLLLELLLFFFLLVALVARIVRQGERPRVWYATILLPPLDRGIRHSAGDKLNSSRARRSNLRP